MAGLLDNYMSQVQDYKKAGSIGSGLLPDRPNLELGQQGLLGQMQAAESEYLKRVSDPLPYYQQNPEAQGLLNVSPELDLIDMATGGGKMAMAGAIKNAAKSKIKGYHGSPHSFDNFDFSHMGSGEGAQAFGWGGYLGGLEDTAIGYRDALSQGNKVVSIDGVRGAAPTDIESWILSQGGDAKKAYSKLSTSSAAKEKSDNLLTASKSDELGMGFSEYDMALMDYNEFQKKLSEIKSLEGKSIKLEPSGNMYEVEFDAVSDDLLDWDAPISSQSQKVKDAFYKFSDSKRGKKTAKSLGYDSLRESVGKYGELEGSDIYELIYEGMPSNDDYGLSQKRVSDYLNKNGVKGVKYADGGSRNTDWQLSTPDTTVSGKWMVKDANQPNSKGLQYDDEIEAKNALNQRGNTSNYVVFDERLMNIAKKYSAAVPISAGLLSGISNSKEEKKTGLLDAGPI